MHSYISCIRKVQDAYVHLETQIIMSVTSTLSPNHIFWTKTHMSLFSPPIMRTLFAISDVTHCSCPPPPRGVAMKFFWGDVLCATVYDLQFPTFPSWNGSKKHNCVSLTKCLVL